MDATYYTRYDLQNHDFLNIKEDANNDNTTIYEVMHVGHHTFITNALIDAI